MSSKKPIPLIDTFQGASPEAMESIAAEKKIRRTSELFLLFAMGSQFDHLIRLALAKIGVFCLVADPRRVTTDDVQKLRPTGIIVSGGPASMNTEPPPFDNHIFDLGIPTLGICLGFQMWAAYLRIPIGRGAEFGPHTALVLRSQGILSGFLDYSQVLQSHGDRVEDDSRLTVLAQTRSSPVAAAQFRHLYGVQFHPEVPDTHNGEKIFENFCFNICGAKDRFPVSSIVEEKINTLRRQIGKRRVLVALSGGCDSSVTAYLLRRAVDDESGRLLGVYLKGLDRPDDAAHFKKHFAYQPWIDATVVDARQKFVVGLRGYHTMAAKRDAVRDVYPELLNDCLRQHRVGRSDDALLIAQGTLYTDISEHGGGYESGARKATIKKHHNVGLNFVANEITPLADCVKDGVRAIGEELGVPPELLYRHPFPGPGLAVRIEGEVTEFALSVASQADGIWISELRENGFYDKVWQAGAVLTSSEVLCTKGDDAAKGRVVSLWAVHSVNGFTATPADLPFDFLRHVDRRITNEIKEVGATEYRLTGKPPCTIEWG